jgi:murein DD-endopeptidase MepM/ murein hydrolase activator NlpD
MSRFLLLAAAAALTGLGACSTPQARYAIVPDPFAATTTPAAEPTPVAAETALAVQAMAESEVETPRAAPLGRVETVSLAQLPPVGTGSPPAPGGSAASPPAGSPAAVADATLSHVVGEGDTFFAIARRYGVGPQPVAELNGLTFASTLRLGQRLQLPAGARDRGPAAARSEAALAGTEATPAPVVAPVRSTVVEPEPPVVQVAQAAAAPAVAAPTAVVPLPIPGPAPVIAQPSTRPSTAPVPTSPVPTSPRTTVAPTSAPVIAGSPAVVAPAPAPGVAAPVSAALSGRGLFVWPLRGDILSNFGPKGVGQRSDGVNISAAEGDPVRASAAGTVVYAGDQVKGGFGKLVLIEHENRWFTAYAHLSDISVRIKERITQNQQIGRAGRTGNVGAPQLYFEVRHAPATDERARPVDPLPLLPQ